MAAMETCSSNDMAETRAKKGKGKGKGKPNKANKCPSVDNLEAMAMEKYAGEICVFHPPQLLEHTNLPCIFLHC